MTLYVKIVSFIRYHLMESMYTYFIGYVKYFGIHNIYRLKNPNVISHV
jgi:hypothetical protein